METLTLTPSTDVKETVDWFRWRGYRAVVTSGTFAPAGVVFSRKNEPAMIAVVGDELVWDGRNIVVKES